MEIVNVGEDNDRKISFVIHEKFLFIFDRPLRDGNECRSKEKNFNRGLPAAGYQSSPVDHSSPDQLIKEKAFS